MLDDLSTHLAVSADFIVRQVILSYADIPLLKLQFSGIMSLSSLSFEQDSFF